MSLVRDKTEMFHLLCHPLPVHRATLSATHHDTGSTYNYYIGVCTNPSTDLYSDEKCMVIQAEHFQNGSTGAVRCLGRMDSAQLTDTLSKCVYVL